MSAIKTNYFDPSGQMHTGYIIDGRTYKDEGGTQRVDVGSIVETADGFYTMTDRGGVKTDFSSGSSSNKNSDKNSTQNAINGLKEQNRLALESLYDKNKQSLLQQKEAIKNDYLRQAQNEYIRSMESKKNINQLMKAQGLHGGMSESSLLENELAHENNLNDLKILKDESLREIDNELLKLRSETDFNIATGNTEYDKLYMEYMDKNLDRELEKELNKLKMEEEIRQFNENMAWDRELEEIRSKQFYDDFNWDQLKFWTENDFEKEKFAHEVNMDNKTYNLNAQKSNKSSSGSDTSYNRALQQAKILAEYGDFSGYAKLFGLSEEQVKNMKNSFDATHMR